MAIDDLIRALDVLDTDEDREQYVLTILENPKHPQHEDIPKGVWYPKEEFPEHDEIQEKRDQLNNQWNHIRSKFSIIPDQVEEAFEKYSENMDRMQEISLIPQDNRKLMPLSNLPGYRGKALYNLVKRSIPLWESESITLSEISPQRIGSGAYGDVHILEQPDGSRKAIKFFRPSYMIAEDQKHTRTERIDAIKKNLMKNRAFFSTEQDFANLRSIPLNFGFYISDFAEGDSLSNLIGKNDPRIILGLRAFAGMLDKVHQRNMIFTDVKPDSILIDGLGNAKICDYDFCTDKAQIDKNPELFRAIKAPLYIPLETLNTDRELSSITDLEQFGYIIDQVYTKVPFLTTLSYPDMSEYARFNRRTYPKSRLDAIPEPLKDLTEAVLSYPRDESVTAKDFYEALKKL